MYNIYNQVKDNFKITRFIKLRSSYAVITWQGKFVFKRIDQLLYANGT